MSKETITPKTKPEHPTEKNINNNIAFLTDLRKLLVKYSGGCSIQNGYPCGTCLTNIFSDLLTVDAPEYNEHNDPVDRVNEIWRGILQMRELDPFYQELQAKELDNL
jgi:hypothetical protein